MRFKMRCGPSRRLAVVVIAALYVVGYAIVWPSLWGVFLRPRGHAVEKPVAAIGFRAAAAGASLHTSTEVLIAEDVLEGDGRACVADADCVRGGRCCVLAPTISRCCGSLPVTAPALKPAATVAHDAFHPATAVRGTCALVFMMYGAPDKAHLTALIVNIVSVRLNNNSACALHVLLDPSGNWTRVVRLLEGLDDRLLVHRVPSLTGPPRCHDPGWKDTGGGLRQHDFWDRSYILFYAFGLTQYAADMCPPPYAAPFAHMRIRCAQVRRGDVPRRRHARGNECGEHGVALHHVGRLVRGQQRAGERRVLAADRRSERRSLPRSPAPGLVWYEMCTAVCCGKARGRVPDHCARA